MASHGSENSQKSALMVSQPSFPQGDKAAELPGMDRGTTEKLLSSP